MTSATAYSTAAAGFGDAGYRLRALLDRTASLFGVIREGTEAEGDARYETGNRREPSMERLAKLFGLDEFEVDLVLLCAAAELDPEAAGLCAIFHDDARLTSPTFRMVLALLPEARWSAVLPSAPLRRWRLLEVLGGDLLTTAPLRVAEPVLHFLMGSACLDESLAPLLRLVEQPVVLPSCYRPVVERLASLLVLAGGARTVAQLAGDATTSKRQLAAAACAAAGLRLYSLAPASISGLSAGERDGLERLLERDAALCGFGLLLELDGASPQECLVAAELADNFAGVRMVSGNAPLALRRHGVDKLVVDRPGAMDRHGLWLTALGADAAGCGATVDRLATEFALDCESILRIAASARQRVQAEADPEGRLEDLLMAACQADAGAALGSLAQRIEVRAGWPDLVLPESSLEVLRAIAAQVRQQRRVLEDWGFAQQTGRGLGISALFHGGSGTGKTLAAEVLAGELQLDLFRIDLSQMVSKYIGETEKNLRTIFDAAESTGAVLLFDEADALFGKRSEVRDSHDRYANIEVSYLLQRVECYRGLAILTTNLRAAMDTAFQRRISFFVNFPFPDAALRRSIWQRVFPAAMPAEGIDYDKLSRLNLPGGNIRNIALHGAYIAADRGEPVRMEHLLLAARRECAKIERTMSAAETGGWV